MRPVALAETGDAGLRGVRARVSRAGTARDPLGKIGNRAREPAPEPRPVERTGRVIGAAALAQQEPVEGAERGDPPGHGRGRPGTLGDPGAELRDPKLLDRGESALKVGDLGCVGLDRAGEQAPLDAQPREPGVHLPGPPGESLEADDNRSRRAEPRSDSRREGPP